ncbi:hypothetical protein DFH27DRAFT_639367 [Peziza echinospora]|nr:hypothetical protein DFH27DRAFT_639367 [Peziza echinospora]
MLDKTRLFLLGTRGVTTLVILTQLRETPKPTSGKFCWPTRKDVAGGHPSKSHVYRPGRHGTKFAAEALPQSSQPRPGIWRVSGLENWRLGKRGLGLVGSINASAMYSRRRVKHDGKIATEDMMSAGKENGSKSLPTKESSSQESIPSETSTEQRKEMAIGSSEPPASDGDESDSMPSTQPSSRTSTPSQTTMTDSSQPLPPGTDKVVCTKTIHFITNDRIANPPPILGIPLADFLGTADPLPEGLLDLFLEVEFSLKDFSSLMLCERGRMEEHRASARARRVVEALIAELDAEHARTHPVASREGRKRKTNWHQIMLGRHQPPKNVGW